MSKIIDFNQLNELGIIGIINKEILNPIDLHLDFNSETGTSNGCIVGENKNNNINEDIKNFTVFLSHKEEILKDLCEDITEEQYNDFISRLESHKNHVRNFGWILSKKHEQLKNEEFNKRLNEHDNSKCSNEEKEGYKWINAHYNLGVEYPNENIKQLTEKSWNHHKQVNRHHPEYFENINDMSFEDVAEMCSDWKSMEYINKYSKKIREFYTDIGSKKYKEFDEKHRRWILDFIDILENVKEFDSFNEASDYLYSSNNGHGRIVNSLTGKTIRTCKCRCNNNETVYCKENI